MKGQDMEKRQAFEDYINNIHIKSVKFGGYDKNDVDHMLKEIIVLMNDVVTTAKKREAALKDRYETRIQALEMTIRSLDQKLSLAEQDKEVAVENAKEVCVLEYSEKLQDCIHALDVLTKEYQDYRTQIRKENEKEL